MRWNQAACEHLHLVLGVVMIDQASLDRAAVRSAQLRIRGQLLEDDDLLIAGIALIRDMTLATHNTGHRVGIVDLRVEDCRTSSPACTSQRPARPLTVEEGQSISSLFNFGNRTLLHAVPPFVAQRRAPPFAG
jgi:hypothetical protein